MTREQALEEFLKHQEIEDPKNSSVTLDLGDNNVLYEQEIDFIAPTDNKHYDGLVTIKESNIFETLEVAKKLRQYDKLIKTQDPKMFDIDFGVIEVISEILEAKDEDSNKLIISDLFLAIRLFTAIISIAGPSIGADSKQPQGSAIGGAPRR